MLIKDINIDRLLGMPVPIKSYMAGFFDGEGHVSIAKRGKMRCSRTDETKTKPVYGLVAGISQNSVEVLKLFSDWFDGTLRLDNRKRSGYTPRATTIWEWNIGGNLQVPVFLRILRPYLIVKAAEVDIALEFARDYKNLNETGIQALVDKLHAVRKSRTIVAEQGVSYG